MFDNRTVSCIEAHGSLGPRLMCWSLSSRDQILLIDRDTRRRESTEPRHST